MSAPTPAPGPLRPLVDLLPGMPAGEVCGPDGCPPVLPAAAEPGAAEPGIEDGRADSDRRAD